MRGPNRDLKRQILDRIDAQTAVWTPVDFLELGARASVDKALQRLAAGGDIRRLDRGLYDRRRSTARPRSRRLPRREPSSTPWRDATRRSSSSIVAGTSSTK